MRSRASYALLRVLQVTTGVHIATRCRVHKSRVSRWASGQGNPSERCKILLERMYGIHVSWWPVNRIDRIRALRRLRGRRF